VRRDQIYAQHVDKLLSTIMLALKRYDDIMKLMALIAASVLQVQILPARPQKFIKAELS